MRPFSIQVRVEHGGAERGRARGRRPAERADARPTTARSFTIEGIREKLRVLLVSGEPHAGERTWRNLLKSDANVDLVHFTILRPPEKQDGTPINELSLIAFPTRELFQQKIKEFDLIIFDRYANQSMPALELFREHRALRARGRRGPGRGGPGIRQLRQPRADAARADHSRPARTARIVEQPYKARITDTGERHPVTRDLPGSEQNPPAWGEWLRIVGSQVPIGLDPDVGRERPAAPRAAPRGEGPRRPAPVRSRLAVGARLSRRADRISISCAASPIGS